VIRLALLLSLCFAGSARAQPRDFCCVGAERLEADAAQWLLARPDITEAELRAAHPATDAPALLQKLRDAALLIAT